MLTVLVIVFLCLYVFYRIGNDLVCRFHQTMELIHAKWEKAGALYLLYRQSETIVLTSPVMTALDQGVVDNMKNNSLKTMEMCRHQMLEIEEDLKSLSRWGFLEKLLFVSKHDRITVNQMIQETQNYWIRMNIDLD